MTTEVLELLRAANVALLSLAVVSLIVWLSDTWGGLSRGRQMSMASIRLLLLGGVVGSAIKYATHAPVDVSIVVVTVGSLGVILGQWLARNEGNPPAGIVPAAALLAIVEGVEDDAALPPCEHPGCIRARIELRNLANPTQEP